MGDPMLGFAALLAALGVYQYLESLGKAAETNAQARLEEARRAALSPAGHGGRDE